MSNTHNHPSDGAPKQNGGHCDSHSDAPACCPSGKRIDWLFWTTFLLGFGGWLLATVAPDAAIPYLSPYAEGAREIVNKMWWGLLLGILFVGLVGLIPRELVMAALGRKTGPVGIVRATAAGVALDLCSHGILLVGMRLYERGASLGQVMAFLIASPWNSLSLTFILWALVGWQWTLVFIAISAVIAVISGLIFEALVARGTLPANPNRSDLPENFHFWPEFKKWLRNQKPSTDGAVALLKDSFSESRMILRWIFVGVVAAAAIRAFVDTSTLQTFFGPTLAGLGLTLVAATIIEVCSEGSVPIAAELHTRAAAPGNAFAFLMTGVATDYTEIMSLRERTKSWKIALFLPLVTVPQVVILAWLMNVVGA